MKQGVYLFSEWAPEHRERTESVRTSGPTTAPCRPDVLDREFSTLSFVLSADDTTLAKLHPCPVRVCVADEDPACCSVYAAAAHSHTPCGRCHRFLPAVYSTQLPPSAAKQHTEASGDGTVAEAASPTTCLCCTVERRFITRCKKSENKQTRGPPSVSAR